jgi:hypothetical protein
VKRSKHITLDDLPPKYREQAKLQLWGGPDVPLGANCSTLERRTVDVFVPTAKESLQVRKDRKPKGPNKTEQLFNREMLGDLGMYEAIRLRLPGGSFYTPDYCLSVLDPQTQQYETTVYEVKGSYKLCSHGRALTAFREARAAFPFLTFKWYEKQKGGGWIERYKG